MRLIDIKMNVLFCHVLSSPHFISISCFFLFQPNRARIPLERRFRRIVGLWATKRLPIFTKSASRPPSAVKFLIWLLPNYARDRPEIWHGISANRSNPSLRFMTATEQTHRQKLGRIPLIGGVGGGIRSSRNAEANMMMVW